MSNSAGQEVFLDSMARQRFSSIGFEDCWRREKGLSSGRGQLTGENLIIWRNVGEGVLTRQQGLLAREKLKEGPDPKCHLSMLSSDAS